MTSSEFDGKYVAGPPFLRTSFPSVPSVPLLPPPQQWKRKGSPPPPADSRLGGRGVHVFQPNPLRPACCVVEAVRLEHWRIRVPFRFQCRHRGAVAATPRPGWHKVRGPLPRVGFFLGAAALSYRRQKGRRARWADVRLGRRRQSSGFSARCHVGRRAGLQRRGHQRKTPPSETRGFTSRRSRPPAHCR